MSMDFEKEAGKSDPASLEKVRALALELISVETAVGNFEDQVTALKSLASKLKTQDLPQAMAEIGMASFTMDDGQRIEIVDFASGSLPKEEELRKAALEYLESLGGGDLVRTFIELSFGKKEAKEAAKAIALLKKAGLDFEVQQNVHSASLAAFVKEAIREGQNIDPKALGVYFGTIAKVKAAKKTKAKKEHGDEV
jgi:hypothetical protein